MFTHLCKLIKFCEAEPFLDLPTDATVKSLQKKHLEEMFPIFLLNLNYLAQMWRSF